MSGIFARKTPPETSNSDTVMSARRSPVLQILSSREVGRVAFMKTCDLFPHGIRLKLCLHAMISFYQLQYLNNVYEELLAIFEIT